MQVEITITALDATSFEVVGPRIKAELERLSKPPVPPAPKTHHTHEARWFGFGHSAKCQAEDAAEEARWLRANAEYKRDYAAWASRKGFSHV